MPESNRVVLILGTSHAVTGAGRTTIDDPDYSKLINTLIDSECLDFVFEEAAEVGQSMAKRLAESRLGANRYCDIDPPRDSRPQLGLAMDSGDKFPVDPMTSTEWVEMHFVEEHEKREELWVRHVLAKDFKRALLVCGFAHVLSLSFRLKSAGLEVKAYSYMPYRKLCGGKH